MNKINFIKALVFVLTFAIFFGLVVMVNIMTNKDKKTITEVDGEISLRQPLGSTIQSVLAKGNYLYIVVSGGNLSDRVVIFDADKKNIISNISLN